jgi:hypothetical protein
MNFPNEDSRKAFGKLDRLADRKRAKTVLNGVRKRR